MAAYRNCSPAAIGERGRKAIRTSHGAIEARHLEDCRRSGGRYGLERVLYRLSMSRYAAQFILKGAALFQLWTGQPHRSTLDLDLLGYGTPSPERLQTIFIEICSLAVEDDGLMFSPETIKARQDQRRRRVSGDSSAN